MPNSQLFYTVLAMVKETAWGAGGARNIFVPVLEPRFQPRDLRHIPDNGLRGIASEDFDLLPGPGEGLVNWRGDVYIDTFPHLLNAFLGQATVTGAAAPYTHTLALSAAPPSYAVEWAQDVQPYLFTGVRFSQLQINFNAREGSLNYSIQGMGKLATEVAATTANFSTEDLIPGWQGTITVGGGPPAALLEGQLTFTRNLRPIHGLNNTQDLAAIYALRLGVTARLTFDYSQKTEWDYYGGASGPVKNAVVLKFIKEATNREITFTFTKAAWQTVTLEPADNLYTAVANLRAIHNTTDGGPVKVTVANSRATAY